MLQKQKQHLKENLSRLKSEIEKLINKPETINNSKFLRRIALDITHINYNAKHTRRLRKAEEVVHFLNTPLGAPFVLKTTLLKAAINFSEQDPLTSDLHHILKEISVYGPKFSLQLLGIFSSMEP